MRAPGCSIAVQMDDSGLGGGHRERSPERSSSVGEKVSLAAPSVMRSFWKHFPQTGARLSKANLEIAIPWVNLSEWISPPAMFLRRASAKNNSIRPRLPLLREMGMVRCLLLVANFPRMNFTQLHERLRLELQRRIQRGSLTVSLLARQTGLGQSHLSNFLHSRRQLSLEAMDRVLAAQHLLLFDLVASATRVASAAPEESSSVPVVSHAAAMFEPII